MFSKIVPKGANNKNMHFSLFDSIRNIFVKLKINSVEIDPFRIV